MASLTESLKFLITANADNAISAFEKTGKAADKNLGKSGAQGSIDKIAGNLTKTGAGAVAFAGIAGTALFKVAGKFEDLAIESGKFSDATGTSVEDASRLIEVVGKLGIDVGAAEKSIGFMNKTLGKTPQAFDDVGVAIARNKDGTTDVVGTYGNVIDRLNEIPDAGERAAAGAQLLGKGWMSMAEVVKGGSAELKTAMAEVGDAQVINPAELQKAKDMRAAMDDASDAIANLVLGIGAGAAPVITTLATGFGHVVDVVGKLDGVSGGAVGSFAAMATAAIGVVGAISFVGGQALKMRDRFTTLGEDGTRSLTGLGKAASGAATGIALAGVALAGLQILDAVTANANDAGDALNEFVVTAGGLKTAKQSTGELLEAWQKMSEKVDQSQGLWSRTLGDLGHAFDQSGENLAHMKKGFDAIFDKSPEQARALVEALEATATAAAHGDEAAQHWLDKNSLSTSVIAGFRSQVDNAAGAVEVLADEQDNANEKTETAAEATKAAADAAKSHADAVKATADALRDEASLLADQASAMRSAADATYAVADSTDQYDEFLAGLDTSIKEAKGNQADINALYREGTTLAANHADAVVRVATETATANGKTLSATEAQDAWNREMLYSATQATPAMRAEILKYIATANGIPPEKITDIQALIDAGKFEEADALLAELSAARDVSMQAELDEASAAEVERRLAILTRNREVSASIVLKGGPGYEKGTAGRSATGTKGARRGVYLVGEQGPELVRMQGGEQVYNAQETRTMGALESGSHNGPIVSQRSGPMVWMENVTISNGTDATAVASAINLKLMAVM